MNELKAPLYALHFVRTFKVVRKGGQHYIVPEEPEWKGNWSSRSTEGEGESRAGTASMASFSTLNSHRSSSKLEESATVLNSTAAQKEDSGITRNDKF